MSAPKPPSELRLALASLRPELTRAAWFSVCSSLLVLAPSAYMLEVYDRVVNSRNPFTLLMLTLAVIGAYALMEVLEWTRAHLLQHAGRRLDEQLRARVVDAIFQAHFKKLPGGNMQPLHDLRAIREFLGSTPLLALLEAPVSLVFLLLVFAINPLLGWCSLVGAMLQVAIGWLNERGTQPPLLAANRSAMAAQQYASSSLRNAQVIESMGLLRNIHSRWMLRQREFLRLQAQASNLAGGYQALTKLVQTALGSLLLGLGAWLLLHNNLNGGGGMMMVASILGGRVLTPLVQIVTQWRLVVNLREAWQRLDDLLATQPAKPASMALPAPRGRLQVENLAAVAPATGLPIFRNVGFALTPGEVLAVIGPSASGKTTLARLLVGLWPAATGQVRLDGADVFTWDKTGLGPHLGYLPQGVELLDGTIADNIARFGHAAPAKTQAAAKAVGLHAFIMDLPQGYQTQVGPEGAMLSGGQRQRVALARAIYGDPALVVLDEPNSSLDEAGDNALLAAIRDLKARGTTFVVMTHRTHVLAVVDKILLLQDGLAKAFGPRDEVLASLKKTPERTAQPTSAAAVPAL